MRDQKSTAIDACVYLDRPPADPEEFQLTLTDFLQTVNTSILLESDIPDHIKNDSRYPKIIQVNLEAGLEETEEEVRARDSCRNCEAVNFKVHLVVLRTGEPESDFLDDGSSEEVVSSAEIWQLPHVNFIDSWDSLIFESKIKSELFSFVEAALLFSKRGIPLRFRGNKLVFLHGPPGTGKTTLCHALAQKLSVYMSDVFQSTFLIQVNSHSLFSRWFSESGKLVTKLFERIQEMVENKSSLVVVLIDEVESLAMVRKSSSEPSDSVRAVNALLNQLDLLKRHENVLVLTTSNLTEAVDSAFFSRADVKRYVGLPSGRAIYEILRQSILQLKKGKCVRFDACGDVDDREFLRSFTPEKGRRKTDAMAEADAILETILADSKPSNVAGRFQRSSPEKRAAVASEEASWKLKQIAGLSYGLTPRTLEKLPLLIFSKHVVRKGRTEVDLNEYLEYLEEEVKSQFRELKELNSNGAVAGNGYSHGEEYGAGVGRRSR